MKNKSALLLLIFVFLFGCASVRQRQVDRRTKELKATIEPLLGRSEDDVLRALGVPDKIENAGSFKIYRYRKSLGVNTEHEQERNLFTGEPLGRVTSTAREEFDAYDLFFKNNKLSSWKANIQR